MEIDSFMYLFLLALQIQGYIYKFIIFYSDSWILTYPARTKIRKHENPRRARICKYHRAVS